MVDEDLSELEKSLEEDGLGEEAGGMPEQGAPKAAAGGDAKANFELTQEQKSNLNMLLDLPLKVKVELGRARVLIQDILQYGQGSVVELNKSAGDTLEVTVNNQLVAKGEVVVVNEKFALRITEIVDAETRIKRLGAAGRDSTRVLENDDNEMTQEVPEVQNSEPAAEAPEGEGNPAE